MLGLHAIVIAIAVAFVMASARVTVIGLSARSIVIGRLVVPGLAAGFHTVAFIALPALTEKSV